MKKIVSVTLIVLSLSALGADQLPASVGEAHAAYLRCDGNGLYREARKALLESSNHPLIVKNVSGLFKVARENGCLEVTQTGFTLPATVSYLEFEVSRRHKLDQGRVTFGLNASLGIRKPQRVEQLQVVRYPDQTVLDLKANLGDAWPTETAAEHELWMGGAQSAEQVEEGLYLVNLKLHGQPEFKAHFILANKNSSASPVLVSPALGGQNQGARPTFSWKPFQSPERTSRERLRVNVSVRREEMDADDLLWVRLKDEKATSFRVGDRGAASDYQGASSLTPDKYILQVSYKDVEYFGDVGVKRGSTTRVPFTVK